MSSPLISIITCTKNSGRFLADNIASVSAQTHRDFEHVFVDGGSTDSTLTLISRYRRKFPRLVKLFSSPPRGISAAMNVGLVKSRGRFLIYLHSDDALAGPDVLSDTAAFISRHPRLDWFYSQIQVIEADGKPVGVFPRQWLLRQAYPRLLKFINFIPHQAVFIKRQVLADFGGFDATLSSQMDLDLWLRLADCSRWQFFPHVISRFRIHPSAQSSGISRFAQNQANFRRVIRRHTAWEYPVSVLIENIFSRLNPVLR